MKPEFLFLLDGIRYEALRVLERRWGGEEVLLARRWLQSLPAGQVVVRRLRSPVPFERRQRLIDEVRLAFLLHHPAIAQVHHCTLHRGAPHVIMEYIEGPTVETVVTLMAMRDRPVSTAFALYVGAEVADALHHAHTLKDSNGGPLGIIHRDVSPRNIALDGNGAVKLMHFGAAYSLMTGREVSPELLLKGDVAYGSPEYFRGEPLSPAADVFSLGLVLVELLTGRHLFRLAEEAQAMPLAPATHSRLPQPEQLPSLPFEMMGVLFESFGPEDVELAVAALPAPLKALLHKALRRAPGERYASAAELRDALRAELAGWPAPYGRKEAMEEVGQLLAEAAPLSDKLELLHGEDTGWQRACSERTTET
jgi:serine/threonine-protein kinase